MVYHELLGDNPGAAFLLAVVGKRIADFPDFEDVYPRGSQVIVAAGGFIHRLNIPAVFQADVDSMDDVLTSGMSHELETHIARVLGHE